MDESDQKLIEAILDFDEDEVLNQVRELKKSKSPLEIMEICRIAMDKIGQMFADKEIFLTELIMSGELLNSVMEELGLTSKSLEGKMTDSKGKILLGTVKDDIHDIGKNILKSLLISNGFEVIDIGVDIPPEKFVEEAKKIEPQVVAMSGLLTVAYDSMKATIDAFEREGIRSKFKIIVGGGSTDKKVAEYVGADDFGESAIDGVNKIKKWLSVA
ncbi:MAG: cobalamin B12-binding domain-containing protein [Promethearchaeota archaeon]